MIISLFLLWIFYIINDGIGFNGAHFIESFGFLRFSNKKKFETNRISCPIFLISQQPNCLIISEFIYLFLFSFNCMSCDLSTVLIS